MEGKRLIQTIRLTNILSYGDKGEEVALEPLNVLIGPNASGKSNFIEAIGLLSATPRDLTVPIRQGGGIGEWLWKGSKKDPIAEIETTIGEPGGIKLHYLIRFTRIFQGMSILDEEIREEDPRKAIGDTPKQLAKTSLRKEFEKLNFGRINRKQSILSQVKDWEHYPEITYLGDSFSAIRVYSEWNLGRHSELRKPQQADLPSDFLLEDASNLGMVLNDLEHRSGMRGFIAKKLKEFYEDVDDITTKIQGGTVQIFLHEKGLSQPIPATRLSDGTLRYLCLLTLLCHPEPPPLLCVEEPELGLHPDILPTIAELLIDASQRTQLVVTTHSDILVSALTEVPESVLVCEQDHDGSHLKRLEREKLKTWLEKYTLGELWTMGEIGGTRW